MSWPGLRIYADEEIIFHQGSPADSLIVLLRGQARIVAAGIFLVARAPYSVIGEQAFVNATPRSATVVAQGTVRALVMPSALVERLLEDAAFCRNLLRLVSDKLIEATGDRAYRGAAARRPPCRSDTSSA